MELARGIEPPTCGLQISDRGLLKSLKIWAIPPSCNHLAHSTVVGLHANSFHFSSFRRSL